MNSQIRQRLLQFRFPRARHLRFVQVELVEVRQPGQFLHPRVRHFCVTQWVVR